VPREKTGGKAVKAVRVRQNGGPEALSVEDVDVPEPNAGEARVKIDAIGVNFIDIYQRSGLYSLQTPFTLGMEGAGVVDAVGAGVTEVKQGDRVAYAMVLGSYAEYATVPAWKLAPLPAHMDAKSAAAIMLQGMTAHYLTHSTYPLYKGETALIHAAAGGVGLLLVQMAKDLGATVVYDSVGQTTFNKSLDSLRPRGYMVLFGQSSGPVPPVDLGILAAKGSLFLTRPTLLHYAMDRAELLERTGDLFNWIAADKLKLHIDRTFPLAEAAEAHRQLAGRKTAGKVLLVP
jgi:NADPH2:quinone reductase